ncbi:MAG: hypothetical protein Q7N50_04115 [Armatimonadota bacterium]|nr:hypothetical protein [Armatimonadota bacterium]
MSEKSTSHYVFKTIEEALNGECGKTFWASIRNGSLDYGDKETLFGKHLDEDLTFDIGNNRILMNLDLKGTILNFVSYGETYPYDHPFPGVWTQKYYQHTKNLSYKIKVGAKTYDLKDLTDDYGVCLLGNVLPVTEFYVDEKVQIKLIAFAPISADGAVRPSAAFYGLFIKNISGEKVKGVVYAPESSERITVRAADGIEAKPEIDYEIRSGKSFWLPLVLSAVPAEDALKEISKHGSIEWLRSTLTYFRNLTGDLHMPQDVYAGEFLERCLHQCFNATVMAPSGEIAGENSWGSYPLRDEMWMKDFHYTYMPLVMADPDLARRGILWFLKWSVRFTGRFPGGVEHSISNSLAPVGMAAMYYANTGDKKFFNEHPEVKDKCKWLLDEALSLRKHDAFLVASRFISDGGSAGDYHTGSNIFAWYCLTAFGRVLEEVYNDAETAASYRKAAEKIKKDLAKHNIIDGPFGKQYVEGIDADGKLPMKHVAVKGVEDPAQVPYMAHDGEESDTTLASFYGYTTYDDLPLHNLKKFALSEHNILYMRNLHGIVWADPNSYGTTFPGYISGLAAATDHETMSGQDGLLTRIRRLTDLDGSIWWWPFTQWKTTYRINDHPARGLGKCGWASGVFCCLFISQVLGVSYDAPSRTLSFRPFSPSSDFTWDGFRLGESSFTASFRREASAVVLEVTNLNSHTITVKHQAILPKGKTAKSLTLDGIEFKGKTSTDSFFESKVVVLEAKAKRGETSRLRVEY